MLSITECRRHLKNHVKSTEEIEEIRDCLYQLADLLVNDYLKENKNQKGELTSAESTHLNSTKADR